VLEVKITQVERLVAVMLVTQAIIEPKAPTDPSLY
jgi:hypothetical protein